RSTAARGRSGRPLRRGTIPCTRPSSSRRHTHGRSCRARRPARNLPRTRPWIRCGLATGSRSTGPPRRTLGFRSPCAWPTTPRPNEDEQPANTGWFNKDRRIGPVTKVLTRLPEGEVLRAQKERRSALVCSVEGNSLLNHSEREGEILVTPSRSRHS